jgi:hypothetical protein
MLAASRTRVRHAPATFEALREARGIGAKPLDNRDFSTGPPRLWRTSYDERVTSNTDFYNYDSLINSDSHPFPTHVALEGRGV